MNSGKPYGDGADGNPEPSRRYTPGRCRDYLSASVALNDRLERPAPLRGEEIVHSLRKRRGRSESLGPRFESERAHQLIVRSRSEKIGKWQKHREILHFPTTRGTVWFEDRRHFWE